MGVGGIWTAFFLSYIALATFGIVNVVTSIFVESAMASQEYFMDIKIQDALAAKRMHLQHLINFFDSLDADQSGTVSFQELQMLLDDPHFLVYLESINRSGADVVELFQLLDADGSGSITIDEFCDGFLKLKGEAKSFDVHRLSQQTIEQLSLLQKVSRRTQTQVQDVQELLAELTGHEEMLELQPENGTTDEETQDEKPHVSFDLPTTDQDVPESGVPPMVEPVDHVTRYATPAKPLVYQV